MNTCFNCIYRVYDEQWGYYKCDIYNHRLRDVYKYADCESHEKKESKKKNKKKEDER